MSFCFRYDLSVVPEGLLWYQNLPVLLKASNGNRNSNIQHFRNHCCPGRQTSVSTYVFNFMKAFIFCFISVSCDLESVGFLHLFWPMLKLKRCLPNDQNSWEIKPRNALHTNRSKTRVHKRISMLNKNKYLWPWHWFRVRKTRIPYIGTSWSRHC